MTPDGEQSFPPGAKRHITTLRAIALSIVLGVAGVAAPNVLDFDQGEISLSSTAAFAKDQGDNGGGGNGGGGDGGNDKDKDKDNNSGGNGGGNNSGGIGKRGNKGAGAAPAAEPDGAAIIPAVIAGRKVVRAQFTTVISRRYPANRVSSVDDPHQAVSFFTELAGMQGQTVTHRWTYRGAVEYEVSFTIRGPKWRFWSTHVLPADKPGTWQVQVVDDSNKVLETGHLDYRPVS